MFKKFLGCGGILTIGLVVAAVGGLWAYKTYGRIWNEGVARETTLNKQYLVNQNELSSYVTGFYEQFNLAQAKSDRMDEIIKDAVKGRYDGKAGGSLANAITEAYPDLKGLDIFDKIADYVQKKRDQYRDQQNVLLTELTDYQNWLGQGPIEHLFKGWLFPSDRLEARIGNNVTHGKDALNQMFRIVIASNVKDAYETGIQDPLPLPTRDSGKKTEEKSGK